MIGIAPDLFAWAARRPPETVIDFDTRRKTLPRWHQLRQKPLAYYDRAVARMQGRMAPAPILRLLDQVGKDPTAFSQRKRAQIAALETPEIEDVEQRAAGRALGAASAQRLLQGTEV